MSKYILVAVILLGCSLLVRGGEAMIGPGKWKIHNLQYKEGYVKDIIIDLRQKMLNRTHYVYSGQIIARIPLDEQLGVKIDVSKFMDGGYKPYQILSDESFISFVNKYAEGNIKTCLEVMGVDPPELPLAKGEYIVENFMIDVDQLPEKCIYGRFIAEACAVSSMGIPVGCVLCESECEPFERDRDSDEEE